MSLPPLAFLALNIALTKNKHSGNEIFVAGTLACDDDGYLEGWLSRRTARKEHDDERREGVEL